MKDKQTRNRRNINSPTKGKSSSKKQEKQGTQPNSRESSQEKDTKKKWGRNHSVSWALVFQTFILMIMSTVMTNYVWSACNQFDCEILGPIKYLMNSKSIFWAIVEIAPKPTWIAAGLYLGWLLFQGILYQILPANIGYGQPTPAGYTLPYKVNGLLAYIITHFLFIVLSFYLGWFSTAIIQEHHSGLLMVTQIYGCSLALFSYIKAHYFPTHEEDRKFSGSIIYDFFMGVEMNPRLGELWDFKLFHNGRPGIIAWTLINLSFLGAQYKEYGYVTNSMILVNLFHATYVIDFFYNEDWYLRTIDIAHDHFGWYLCYGDTVFLPFMYNIQTHYLYRHPVNLTNLQVALVLGVALLGYGIFRAANHQKDIVRRTHGNCSIWGKKAKVIEAQYTSSDGKAHKSLLLCSGFWGLSRHFNYVGDILFALSMCMCCGFSHILPYQYLFILTGILIHRIQRDQQRCSGKYGVYWDRYCKEVKYKLIPFIY